MKKGAAKKAAIHGVELDVEALRAAREAKGLSQKKLAHLIISSTRSIERAESSGATSLATFKKICSALGVNADALRAKKRGHAAPASVNEPQTAWVAPPPAEALERVRVSCEYHSDEEMKRYAAKKYIPALYVQREIERDIDYFLASEAEVRSALAHLQRLTQSQVAQLQSSLAENETSVNGKLSAARKRKGKDSNEGYAAGESLKDLEERKKRLQAQIAELGKITPRLFLIFDELDSAESVTAPVVYEMIKDLLVQIKKIRQFSSANSADDTPSDQRAIDDYMRKLDYRSNVSAVVVDRAGGGKTNLLCHVTKSHAGQFPILFVVGRLAISSVMDLELVIQERVGLGTLPRTVDWVAYLDGILKFTKGQLAICIDGINENRSTLAISQAVAHLVERTKATRVRILVTCRDIYWAFFESEQWARAAARVSGTLHEFTETEHHAAMKAYLGHYNISVLLGEHAVGRCRHPLLLRFFCEAHHRADGTRVDLGYVAEIRLKNLFDVYWSNKVSPAGGDKKHQHDEQLMRIVVYMYSKRVTALDRRDYTSTTGISDLTSEASPYVQLLDEDIILEETPINASERRVIFVYEEFMEYAIARGLYAERAATAKRSVTALFSELTEASASYVNALGIGEYYVAFQMVDQQYAGAAEAIFRMCHDLLRWKQIIGNLFTKYDDALATILALPADQLIERRGDLILLLDHLGGVSKQLFFEATLAVIMKVAFPDLYSVQTILSSLPVSVAPVRMKSQIDVDEKSVTRCVRQIAAVVKKYQLNPTRAPYWAGLAGRAPISHFSLAELMKKLWSVTYQNSPRFAILAAYSCNGLYSVHKDARLVAALLSFHTRNQPVRAIRQHLAQFETDSEIARELGKTQVHS